MQSALEQKLVTGFHVHPFSKNELACLTQGTVSKRILILESYNTLISRMSVAMCVTLCVSECAWQKVWDCVCVTQHDLAAPQVTDMAALHASFLAFIIHSKRKNSRPSKYGILTLYLLVLQHFSAFVCCAINPLKTKRRLLYLKTQFVPRSKHFSSRL